MAKGKETKDMRRRLPFRPEVLGQMSFRADCSEDVPSAPGFSSRNSNAEKKCQKPHPLRAAKDGPPSRQRLKPKKFLRI